MIQTQHGYTTTDPSREKGWKEGKGQDHLQCEACTNAGSTERKKDRIIYVENSSNITYPLVLKEISTVEELIQGICDMHPKISLDYIGMRVTTARLGVVPREYITDKLPYEKDTFYVNLYLKKHPPVPKKVNLNG